MARQGTLTLPNSGYTVALDDPANGWLTTQLDLGFPEVREDDEVNADRHGLTDYTRLLGKRTVSIQMTLSDDSVQPMTIDELLVQLTPFLDPGQRPVLTYALDNRNGDETFRTMVLRADQFSAPLAAKNRTEVQLQFIAADPRAYSLEPQEVSLWAVDPGHSTGRTYPLTFDRVYPSSPGPQVGSGVNEGALSTWLTIRFYGPVTGAVLQWVAPYDLGSLSVGCVAFQSSYTIPAGEWIDVDTMERTVLLNGEGNRFGNLDFTQTSWVGMAPQIEYAFGLTGTGTSDATQCLIQWNDAYLI
jgi:hypothetical protein